MKKLIQDNFRRRGCDKEVLLSAKTDIVSASAPPSIVSNIFSSFSHSFSLSFLMFSTEAISLKNFRVRNVFLLALETLLEFGYKGGTERKPLVRVAQELEQLALDDSLYLLLLLRPGHE